MSDLPTLGQVSPDELVDPRLQLHWAVQLPAGVGLTLAEPTEDWSHTALTWDAEEHRFLSATTPDGLQAGLTPGLVLEVLEDGEQVARTTLIARTLEKSRTWLADALDAARAPERDLEVLEADRPEPPDPVDLELRDLSTLPGHPVGEGAPFRADPLALGELAAWFQAAHAVLAPVARAHRDAGEFLVWPHHLDAAVLRTLVKAEDEEDQVTIGLGMTPGDQGRDQPYWYATPWPYPEATDHLPELAHGSWHTEGWVGCVLEADELLAHDPDDRQAVLEAYLEHAQEACKAVHEAEGLL